MAADLDIDDLIRRNAELESEIEKLKKMILDFKEREEIFSEFMSQFPGELFIKDSNSNYLSYNIRQFKIHSKENIIKKSTHEVWPEELAKQFISDDQRAMREGLQEITSVVPSGQGKNRYIRTLKFPVVRSGKGALIGGVSIDVTEYLEKERALEERKKEYEIENAILREEVKQKIDFEEIVGSSESLENVLVELDQVAGTNATVLLFGETGTGKDLFAKTIHNQSPRKERLMVNVNCAALPSNLVESELFGHEKGSFTGASATKVGRFEFANQSTIFLDEIGELPMESQAKLLRVLQDGKFERVGSSQTRIVDVRCICATNRDLSVEVKAGRFREDLYYRLNVFPIRIPSLRERIDDIPQLVWKFVREFEGGFKKTVKRIDEATIRDLKSYSWPGNVRELKNVVERALILNKGSVLRIELPDLSAGKNQPGDGDDRRLMEGIGCFEFPELTLKEFERRYITSVVEKTGWRVKGKDCAADILGCKPTTLYSKMKTLKIERPTYSRFHR